MLVKFWMKKPAITIDEDAKFKEAITKFKTHKIHLMPVLKNGRLTGVLTDADLRRSSASDIIPLDVYELSYYLSKIMVSTIMTKDPITIPFDYTIEEAAEILLQNNISGAPVVNKKGKVIGIISRSEIFLAIISLTGGVKRGIQFALRIEDRPGSIREVVDIIRSYSGRTVSILTSSHNVPEGYRNAYMRMYSVDREKLTELKDELSRKAVLLYMVDHLQNRREIYLEN
jgi:acetoin utilization protein AcuB